MGAEAVDAEAVGADVEEVAFFDRMAGMRLPLRTTRVLTARLNWTEVQQGDGESQSLSSRSHP